MQPDIEIYLKDSTQDALSGWLNRQFKHCSAWQTQGKVSRCTCDGIPVSLYEKAMGSWHALVFDSSNTPWENDLACAQAAQAALSIEIRCAPGSWEEAHGEEDGDRWLKVTAQGVEEFLWRG